MTVPGRQILGNLIDHFDFVINESFHGISPHFGNSNKNLFDIQAVCPICIRSRDPESRSLPTLFPIEDLAIRVAQDNYGVTCTRHPEKTISILDLAPDLSLSDLNEQSRRLNIDVSISRLTILLLFVKFRRRFLFKNFVGLYDGLWDHK